MQDCVLGFDSFKLLASNFPALKQLLMHLVGQTAKYLKACYKSSHTPPILHVKHQSQYCKLACRAPVTTLEIGGKTDPWHAIAKALGVEAHALLFWEKLGKVVHIPRLPGYKATDKPQPLLVSV